MLKSHDVVTNHNSRQPEMDWNYVALFAAMCTHTPMCCCIRRPAHLFTITLNWLDIEMMKPAHSLRATVATKALDHQGEEWLGHSNIATMRIYDHSKLDCCASNNVNLVCHSGLKALPAKAKPWTLIIKKTQ